MEGQLKKALNLVRRIGSHLVVYNLGNDKEAYVVMSLEEYERLVLGKNEVRGLTEDELLAKINRDIAIWKNEQEEAFNKPVEEFDFGTKNSNFSQENDLDFYRPQFKKQTEIIKSDKSDKNNKQDKEQRKNDDNDNINKKKWTIPSDRKQGAEEIIEEDMQYLEEI